MVRAQLAGVEFAGGEKFKLVHLMGTDLKLVFWPDNGLIKVSVFADIVKCCGGS
jgi:hypothetical protein